MKSEKGEDEKEKGEDMTPPVTEFYCDDGDGVNEVNGYVGR